jgi:hydrogenase maturation factor
MSVKSRSNVARIYAGVMTSTVAALGAVPAFAHHSFAMYDQTKMLTLTGVVYQFVAQANHAEIHLYVIGEDGKLEKDKEGKPHAYGIEMAGAAAIAEQGISADSMKPGTIISVKVNPLRDGSDFGSKAGNSGLAKCPWKTPPVAGKTCDTVQGREILGAPAF